MELGKRERQIMEAVYRLGRATVAEVRADLPDPPSYSAVRGMLRFLEEKGQLRHVQDGIRYVYLPVAPSKARKSALQRLVHTFFGGSAQEAVAALLEDTKLQKDDLDRLQDLIDQARKEGR